MGDCRALLGQGEAVPGAASGLGVGRVYVAGAASFSAFPKILLNGNLILLQSFAMRRKSFKLQKQPE